VAANPPFTPEGDCTVPLASVTVARCHVTPASLDEYKPSVAVVGPGALTSVPSAASDTAATTRLGVVELQAKPANPSPTKE
jgi:hypothetical protein